jgi:hypothetical protein
MKLRLRRVDLMFLVGAILILGEFSRWRGPPNQAIIFAGLALMGLPIVARGEEKVRNGPKEPKEPSP